MTAVAPSDPCESRDYVKGDPTHTFWPENRKCADVSICMIFVVLLSIFICGIEVLFCFELIRVQLCIHSPFTYKEQEKVSS